MRKARKQQFEQQGDITLYNGIEFKNLKKVKVGKKMYFVGEKDTSIDTRKKEWTTVIADYDDPRKILCRAPAGTTMDYKKLFSQYVEDEIFTEELIRSVSGKPLNDFSRFVPGNIDREGSELLGR